MPNTGNIPATPEEKLYVRMKQAEEFGKEFDETKERSVLQLPPPRNREPIFIPEDRARENLTLNEDRQANPAAEAREQMMADATLSRGQSTGTRIDEIAAENAELRRQIAELSGQSRTPKSPAEHIADAEDKKAAAEAEKGVQNFPNGAPNATWSKPQLRNFQKFHKIVEPEGGSTKLTNTQYLNYVLDQAHKGEILEEV